MTRPRLLGALLALLVLAALLVLLRDQPAGTVVVEPETTPVTAPPAEPLRRDELPALEEPGDGSFSLLQGVVRTLDGAPVPAGSVRLEPRDADHPLPVTEVAVADGRFTYPSTWTEDGLPEPERFLFVGPSGAATSEVLRVEETEDTPLVLTVGRALPWRCRVTDLAGHPIPGATVRVFTRLPYRGFETTTDQDGRAEGVCYSTDTRVGIQAIAFGYAAKRSIFAVSSSREATLELPRLFAVAWYLHPAFVSFSTATAFEPSDVFTQQAHNESYQRVWRELTSTHPVWSDTGKLFLNLYRESIWAEEGPAFELTLLDGHSNVGVFTTVGRPILDGLPEPIVVLDDAYRSFPAFVSSTVVFEPKSAFLCEPPDQIALPILPAGESKKRVALCYHEGDGRYSTCLPEGSFSILGSSSENDPWSSDWITGDAPRFAPGQSIPAAGQRQELLRIALADGESWTEIDVVDRTGVPCYASFWLGPSDGKRRHMVGTDNRLPIRRFIRPGTWDLWYTPIIESPGGPRAANEGAILISALTWPPPFGLSNGRWVIEIPRSTLSLDDFDTLYR